MQVFRHQREVFRVDLARCVDNGRFCKDAGIVANEGVYEDRCPIIGIIGVRIPALAYFNLRDGLQALGHGPRIAARLRRSGRKRGKVLRFCQVSAIPKYLGQLRLGIRKLPGKTMDLRQRNRLFKQSYGASVRSPRALAIPARQIERDRLMQEALFSVPLAP